MNEKIRNLAARIRQGGYVFASGGKLYRKYDGRTEESNRLQFGYKEGVLDNALYPTLPQADVETPTAAIAGAYPSGYLTGTGPTWVDLHQSQIPEDASAIDAVLPGALFYGETLAKLPDVTPPFVDEGYRGERVLTDRQRLLMQALRNRGAVDRRSLETNLLQNPDNVTVQPKMVSNDSVVDDGRGQYAEAKLLRQSDASAAQRAAAALKNADVDTIKAVQAEMYRKGYYKDVKTPPIPMGTKEQNMELQRKLKSYGYDLGTYGPDGDGVDGNIGAKTRAAWGRYVKEHPDEVMLNSVADGKVGPATRRALAAYYKDVYDSMYDGDNYTKVLTEAVSPSAINRLHDSYLDMRNLQNWKQAVANSTEADTNGVPLVNYSWDVSDDMLTRVAGLLPDGLSSDSVPDWTSPTRSDGVTGYPNTWDSPAYIEDNDNAVLSLLRKLGGIAGTVGTSLSQPGRGTIGNFVYRTTPAGIVISDGYQFKAAPEQVVISDKQGKGYNELRSKMNAEHRAGNTNVQTYLIPWDVYNEIHSKHN